MVKIIKDTLEKQWFCVKEDGKDFLYLSHDGKYSTIGVNDSVYDFYFHEKHEIEKLIPET